MGEIVRKYPPAFHLEKSVPCFVARGGEGVGGKAGKALHRNAVLVLRCGVARCQYVDSAFLLPPQASIVIERDF